MNIKERMYIPIKLNGRNNTPPSICRDEQWLKGRWVVNEEEKEFSKKQAMSCSPSLLQNNIFSVDEHHR
ncbi:hypothetical protein TSUD_10870 [Trifolium subterraneum]|nr:hypothetical protein TSUD_10870 [Trifolium subterraneum]